MKRIVLILIVMEHALGEKNFSRGHTDLCVLILIVMEHALGGEWSRHTYSSRLSLNPYCNGTCSRSREISQQKRDLQVGS